MEFRGKYYFLSNMYPCSVRYGGEVYPCVETAFQARKSPSENYKFKINGNWVNGFEAKKIGRRVHLINNWDKIKVNLMTEIVRAKFSNPELKSLLLQTGNEYLVEDNSWGDKFWGVCNGVGCNTLGKILMKVRDEYANS